MFSKKYITLKNNSKWALGIVTGNNKKYISTTQNKGAEAIFKGCDIQKYFLQDPTNFIVFQRDKFQQVAHKSIYRAKEKLIYRFISNSLIFAYDNKGSLTLNSANILIPNIPNYSIKIILVFLNSKLFNFFFKKKFNTIKILRSNIEELPFPILNDEQKLKILNLVNSSLKSQIYPDKIDNLIYKIYKFNKNQINIIEKYFK